jgi:hypothetical protein
LAPPRTRDASRRRPDTSSNRRDWNPDPHPEQLPNVLKRKVNRSGPPVVGASLGEGVGMALGPDEGEPVGREEGEVLGESVGREEGEVLGESVGREEG